MGTMVDSQQCNKDSQHWMESQSSLRWWSTDAKFEAHNPLVPNSFLISWCLMIDWWRSKDLKFWRSTLTGVLNYHKAFFTVEEQFLRHHLSLPKENIYRVGESGGIFILPYESVIAIDVSWMFEQRKGGGCQPMTLWYRIIARERGAEPYYHPAGKGGFWQSPCRRIKQIYGRGALRTFDPYAGVYKTDSGWNAMEQRVGYPPCL